MIVLAKEEPAAEINEADPFKEVLDAIDKLISDLEAEEKVRAPQTRGLGKRRPPTASETLFEEHSTF